MIVPLLVIGGGPLPDSTGGYTGHRVNQKTQSITYHFFPLLVWLSVTTFYLQYISIHISLCPKKQKLKFCFGLLGALEGWYGDPTKRFSNL